MEERVFLDGSAHSAVLEYVDRSGGKREGDFTISGARVELFEFHHFSYLVGLFMSDSSIKISVVFLDEFKVVQQTVREEILPFLVFTAVDQPELQLPQELIKRVVKFC